MPIKRKLKTVATPKGGPGFLGAGHIARQVVGGNFLQTDPFIFLMDDLLDKQDEEPAGGPHPHAGFETVSLLLEGSMGDAAHKMQAGDFQIMTAGSGIIHTETIEEKTRMRLLQMWLNLPKKDRAAQPRVQDLPRDHAPYVSKNGMELRLYSGSLSGLRAPVQNYVPMIVADIRLQPAATAVLDLPARFNSFLYMLEGSVYAGAEESPLNRDQVGWLDRFENEEDSELLLKAGKEGAHLILYAAPPQHEPIVSHGPFIADSEADIRRLYAEYRQGRMQHITTVPEEQRMVL